MHDEYVEVVEVKQAEPVKVMVKERRIPVVALEEDISFNVRMGNWRRVVRGSAGGGGGFCAGWARLYVQTRDAEERLKMVKRYGRDMALLMMPGSTSSAKVSVDELDGWLIEAAVRSLPEFNERRVLQLWYVWQYPEHWIKTKLLLRKGGMRIVLGRATTNLKKILHSVNTAANILSNNLHAGEDPRPESKDAP